MLSSRRLSFSVELRIPILTDGVWERRRLFSTFNCARDNFSAFETKDVQTICALSTEKDLKAESVTKALDMLFAGIGEARVKELRLLPQPWRIDNPLASRWRVVWSDEAGNALLGQTEGALSCQVIVIPSRSGYRVWFQDTLASFCVSRWGSYRGRVVVRRIRLKSRLNDT